MKTFEIFNEQTNEAQNGRKKFRAILYQIQPDSCIDKKRGIGTKYNDNGITWIKEYCKKALPTIKGMSLRCEFLDEERTEICGHGMTEVVDDVPIFEDAVMIGAFDNGYIDEIENSDGEKITVCVGEGEIDSSCYHNFCAKLEENIKSGIFPQGSIEIMRTKENDGIVYKYGYKDFGRIPTEFIHSGYALLGVEPSDKTAKLIELNESEENDNMDKAEIKDIIKETVSQCLNCTNELNECKSGYEKDIDELNQNVQKIEGEKNELIASTEQLQKALKEVQEECKNWSKKWDELFEEKKILEKALAEQKVKERLAKLDDTLSNYSKEEIAFAEEEINAFKENPIDAEISAVEDKILIGIGKQAKENGNKVSEVNAKNQNTTEDIFGFIEPIPKKKENINIF